MDQLPLIIPENRDTRLKKKTETTAELAALADVAAAMTVIERYQLAAAENTLKRQRSNLDRFADYLAGKGGSISGEELFSQVEAWTGISHGLVEGFKLFLVGEGYALSTVNIMLSSIKTYARLAHQARVIDADHYSRIKSVTGYAGRRATEVNNKREVVRLTSEKEEPILVPAEVIRKAKSVSFYDIKKPAELRDRFVVCLLFDLGLRASELADLKIGDIEPEEWILSLYRRKTDHTDRLHLSRDCIATYQAYIPHAPTFAGEPLLLASRKGGHLVERPLTRITVTHLVTADREALGLYLWHAAIYIGCRLMTVGTAGRPMRPRPARLSRRSRRPGVGPHQRCRWSIWWLMRLPTRK